MNSWFSSSSNAGEAHHSRSGWSPIPTGTVSNQPPSSRREHAVQPPPLTTALSGHQFQGLGVALGPGYASTPLSTTSLSSPFTQSQSPCVSSPSSAAVAPSPMASRHYNVPYNPRDWGPVNSSSSANSGQSAYPHSSSSNSLRRSVHRPPQNDPDVLSPPPPPYSPPSHQHQQQSSWDAAHHNSIRETPSGAAPPYPGPSNMNAEPMVNGRQRSVPGPRPLSMVHMGDAGPSSQVSLPPPPPLPQGGPPPRSSSQNRHDFYHGMSSGPSIMVSQESPQFPTTVDHRHAATGSQLDPVAPRPPTSRRAVSAGPVVGSANSSKAGSQSPSRSPPPPPPPPPPRAWEPGMPLPPPPPGPPPTSRSRSVCGSPEASSSRNNMSVPIKTRVRAPPSLGTGLDSIPPTPAGWVDDGIQHDKGKNLSTEANGASPLSYTAANSDNSVHPSTSRGNLLRSPALRDPSAKGIRERRIERRNRQSQVFDDHNALSPNNACGDGVDQVKPSNLVLADPNGDSRDSRAPSSAKYTPRSAQSVESDTPQSTSRSRASSIGLFSSRSSFSTPRAEPSPAAPTRGYTQTPPFSPDGDHPSPYPKSMPQPLPPKALPTPPLQSAREGKMSSRPSSREERPVSHVRHSSNGSMSSDSPILRHRSSISKESSPDHIKRDTDGFFQNSIQRHKDFIDKEASAADEAEALRLFADFVIAESRVRRHRYSQAWDSGSFDHEEVRRKLFETPPVQPPPAPEPINAAPAVLPVRRPSIGPKLDMSHVSRLEPSWGNSYKPSLSPIASLSISNDEMSSRGRAPSRWWESRTGSSSEGDGRKVHRSKQESKYMGLSPGSLQENHHQPPSENEVPGYSLDSSMGQYAAYGPNEYPPEKVGWHEELAPPPDPYMASSSYAGLPKMDVSRLITLPPPYPRHYPAVNNNHPDLVGYRTLVRSISDLSEIKAMRQRHDAEVDRLSQDHKERTRECRRMFKANTQTQIQQGSITFSEAAEAEAALVLEENKLDRALAKQILDLYQASVLEPTHGILTDRISRATTCIDELSSKLFDDAQHGTPDQAQEEGDEKPELLEKLTQLKWLFETREVLHREMYDLVCARNEKYRTVVVLPYRQKANDEKVRETNAFFDQDALDRRAQYESNTLSRLESFLDVIESNVVRGVEVQLSAFWDIAPSLLTLIDEIPPDLNGFEVQIPANEYEENPSYHRHPLQYLYSLLSHAEKSSYQYIESQTNLLCLLHEVKSAVMRANCQLIEAERTRQGEPGDEVQREIMDTRASEERALTADLKDKVSTVEVQWTEAMGSQIQELRERVRMQLEAEDGWEEMEALEQT